MEDLDTYQKNGKKRKMGSGVDLEFLEDPTETGKSGLEMQGRNTMRVQAEEESVGGEKRRDSMIISDEEKIGESDEKGSVRRTYFLSRRIALETTGKGTQARCDLAITQNRRGCSPERDRGYNRANLEITPPEHPIKGWKASAAMNA